MSHHHVLASALSRVATASSGSSSLSDSLFTALQVLTDRHLDLEIRFLADHIVSTRREPGEKGCEERTMARLTKKKIGIQSILKNEWSKTCGISNFFDGLSIHFGGG
jgi:hypothetical protein